MNEAETFDHMLERQRVANEAIYNGDPGPFMALWSQRDPVTLFGAWGTCKRGWDELSRTFQWVGSRFSKAQDLTFEIEVAEVSGDFAYTVGYERTVVSIDGGPPEPHDLRVTHAYRLEEGQWKVVHRHGDMVPLDQSPPN